MDWRLEYTPYVWPAFASTAFTAVLAVYGWRRRSVAGALPFVVLMVCGGLWALSSALELASIDLASKIFWAKLQSVWQPAMVTAGLWFALEYADLRHWLVRRNLIFLAVPPFLWLVLALTNDIHRSLWSGFSFDGWVRPLRNSAAWVFITYGFLLGFATIIVFARLFWRSPLHRVPVALCLSGQIVALAAYGLKTAGAIPGSPVDPVMLSFDFGAVMFACALFRFGLFNLIPIARGTVIDQMREGVLALDRERRILDLNPAAERILGVPATRARGARVTDFMPGSGIGERSEIILGAGDAARHYSLHDSTINDRRGFQVGALILLDDVTVQKQAQAQLMEQQRALATLHERDRVARELHDTLGQVLGYIKMQAAVAQTYLERGEPEEAKRRVVRLAAAAQDAQSDVREYILGTRAGLSGTAPVLPALSNYLRQFGENYGIATELIMSADVADRVFEPMAGAQLLRIIQEALTNVRKHAGARHVDVRIAVCNGHTEAVVQDDGAGFDPAAVQPAGSQRFGLQVMHERAEEVGGAVQIHSAPGEGTRVTITIPLGAVRRQVDA
jgi:signal transduction histidine kinase